MPGKIVVRPIEEQTIGGIILPGSGQSRVMGVVIAIGGDEEEGDSDYDVKVGDVVMFGGNSGARISVDEVTESGTRQRHEVLIFRTAEILCTVTWDG